MSLSSAAGNCRFRRIVRMVFEISERNKFSFFFFFFFFFLVFLRCHENGGHDHDTSVHVHGSEGFWKHQKRQTNRRNLLTGKEKKKKKKKNLNFSQR
jgi:hypothetical protein